MIKRQLDIKEILNRKSIFLFGPRQTGKSTWLKSQFKDALYINLLSKKVYDDYLSNPNALPSDIELFHRKSKSNIIIIDEVQKIPSLLDEVHNQIELNKNLRFILTGSSARKLKRSGANLLGGRATWKSFFPLTYSELRNFLFSEADLVKRINFGGLPSIYNSIAPESDIDDYINLYLNEEIKAEGLTRNHEGFHRFLRVAALTNSKQVNFTQIGSDAQIPPRTVHDYFQILEDTLIGFMLPAFTETVSRKAVASAKFYLFDTGLTHAIVGRAPAILGTTEFGELFEQFIICEVRAFLSYTNSKFKMLYWRSTSQFEVDLVLIHNTTIYAIELKAKSMIDKKAKKGLLAFAEDFPNSKKIIVTMNARRSITPEKIEIFSAIDFLKELWSGKVI